MAGADRRQGAEDRAPEADLHRRPHPRLQVARGALGVAVATTKIIALPTPGLDRSRQRDVVSDHVASAYGALVRICPTCGSVSHGRPRVADRPDLHLSISYADGLAVIAVADGPIGVDVEAEAGRRISVDRAELVAWTRAEAAVKLTGDGIRGAPPADAVVVALTDLPEGYVGALASWGDQAGNGGSAVS